MFGKLNTKTLLVILVILIAVFAAIELTDSSDSSYRDYVADIDTAAVTKIRVSFPEKTDFEVIKKEHGWVVKENGKESDADVSKMKALLVKMKPLKAVRPVTNSSKQWARYGVDDKGIRLTFFQNDKPLTTLVLGKVDYVAPETDAQNPYMRGNQGSMIGYARVDGENEVYVVDGYLKLTFGNDADSFKKKTIVKSKPGNVSQVKIESGDAGYRLSKVNDKWMIDGKPADSANTAKYINNVSRLFAYEYYPPGTIEKLQPVATAVIDIDGKEPITVKAYAVDSVNFAITSTANKGNVLKDKKGKVFERLVKNKSYFLKN